MNRITAKILLPITSTVLIGGSLAFFSRSAFGDARQEIAPPTRSNTDIAQLNPFPRSTSPSPVPAKPIFEYMDSVGKKEGRAFSTNIPDSAVEVSALYVWGGRLVDGFQFVWKDAAGNRIEGDRVGSRGGSPCIQMELTNGQYIRSITGLYGESIDSIVVERSDGYKAYCGGGGGQKSFSFTPPAGKAIWGVQGRVGKYLDALGMIVSDAPQRP